jgi:hypothetical protein
MRLEAAPIGSFSLAGVQTKVTAKNVDRHGDGTGLSRV